FLLHRAEESSELVKIILAPLLVRVMMTPRAFESCAKKQLAEYRREISRLAPITVNYRGAVPMVRSFREQNFTHELIVRFVLSEAVAQPLIEDKHTFHAHAIGVRAEQVSPFVSPVIRVFGPDEKTIDERAAPCETCFGRLAGRRSRRSLRSLPAGRRQHVKKLADLLRRRQHANRVEGSAPDELSVRAQVRREQTEPLELRVGQVVDEIVAR